MAALITTILCKAVVEPVKLYLPSWHGIWYLETNGVSLHGLLVMKRSLLKDIEIHRLYCMMGIMVQWKKKKKQEKEKEEKKQSHKMQILPPVSKLNTSLSQSLTVRGPHYSPLSRTKSCLGYAGQDSAPHQTASHLALSPRCRRSPSDPDLAS